MTSKKGNHLNVDNSNLSYYWFIKINFNKQKKRKEMHRVDIYRMYALPARKLFIQWHQNIVILLELMIMVLLKKETTRLHV